MPENSSNSSNRSSDEKSTRDWLAEFIVAARKNLPNATMRPVLSWVDVALVRKLLNEMRARFYFARFRGNLSLTITGLR